MTEREVMQEAMEHIQDNPIKILGVLGHLYYMVVNHLDDGPLDTDEWQTSAELLDYSIKLVGDRMVDSTLAKHNELHNYLEEMGHFGCADFAAKVKEARHRWVLRPVPPVPDVDAGSGS